MIWYIQRVYPVVALLLSFFSNPFPFFYMTIRPEIIADLQRNRNNWLAVRNNKSLSNAQNNEYDAHLKTNRVSLRRDNCSGSGWIVNFKLRGLYYRTLSDN